MNHIGKASAAVRRIRPVATALAVCAAVTLALVGAAPPAQATQAQWLDYHDGPSNNAVMNEPGRQAVSWRSPKVADRILGVSVVGDRVYAIGAGKTHAVYALDRASGKIAWQRVVDNIVMTQPIVVNGRVFVGTGNNYHRAEPVKDWSTVVRGTGFNSIYALNAATGAVLWKVPLVGEAMPTPLYYNGTLYAVTGDRRFLAIDAASGKVQWQLKLPSYMSMSSPVRDGNLVIFGGAYPYALYAVDVAAHRLAWQHPFTSYQGLPVTGAIDDCSPALYNHTVYCTGTASKNDTPPAGSRIRSFVWAIDARSGQLRWTFDEGAGKLPDAFAAGVPTVVDDVVYVGNSGNASVFALDAGSGRLLWRNAVTSHAPAAPILDGRTLFVSDAKGIVYQFDARSGTLAHRMTIGGKFHNIGFVLAGKTLFVPNMGGVVDAIPESTFTGAHAVDGAPPHGRVPSQGGMG